MDIRATQWPVRRVLVLLLLAVAAAACSSSDHNVTPLTTQAPESSGVAVGRMYIITGGNRTFGKTKPPIRSVAGVVLVRPLDVPKYVVLSTVKVNETGRFRITLRPGRYFLQGRPANTGISQMWSPDFRIKAGRITRIDLVEEFT